MNGGDKLIDEKRSQPLIGPYQNMKCLLCANHLVPGSTGDKAVSKAQRGPRYEIIDNLLNQIILSMLKALVCKIQDKCRVSAV